MSGILPLQILAKISAVKVIYEISCQIRFRTFKALLKNNNGCSIDHFRYVKFSLAARLRVHRLEEHVYPFLLYVPFRPHYQAQF